MVESPVINKIYKGPELNKYREERPEKFLGGPVFVVKGFKNEKDRIAVINKQFYILFHKY